MHRAVKRAGGCVADSHCFVFTAAFRYYVAEGVRLYSQETWRQVVGRKGVELVEEHIQSVVSFSKGMCA